MKKGRHRTEDVRRKVGNIELDIWSSPFGESMSRPARQEIPCTLRNLKFHYRSHNSPTLVPVRIQVNSAYTVFLSSLWFTSMPRYFNFSLSLNFPHQNSVFICCFCSLYVSYSSHCPWFYRPNNIWWGVQIMKTLTVHLLYLPVTSPLLVPNIPLSTHFSDYFRMCM